MVEVNRPRSLSPLVLGSTHRVCRSEAFSARGVALLSSDLPPVLQPLLPGLAAARSSSLPPPSFDHADRLAAENSGLHALLSLLLLTPRLLGVWIHPRC